MLEDSPSIVGWDLMPATLVLSMAWPISKYTDRGHIEPCWLGLNSIDPYKFNIHKQWLVALEKVLGPGDVFLIIQVSFDLKRKVNCHPQLDPAKVLVRHKDACATATILMPISWNWRHPSSSTKHSWFCCGSVKSLPWWQKTHNIIPSELNWARSLSLEAPESNMIVSNSHFYSLWSTKCNIIKGSCSSEHSTPPLLITIFFDDSWVDHECKEGTILHLNFFLWKKKMKIKIKKLLYI